MIKNLKQEEILELKQQVVYQEGQVVSKTITKTGIANISLFAFDKSEGISSHASTGDALVTILDGTAKITINGTEYEVTEGQSILMPANKPHALFAISPFKMLLIIVFGQNG